MQALEAFEYQTIYETPEKYWTNYEYVEIRIPEKLQNQKIIVSARSPVPFSLFLTPFQALMRAYAT